MLDTVLTPELKKEGRVRDLVRFVQDLRKKAGLEPGEKAVLKIKEGTETAFVGSIEDELKAATTLARVEYVDLLSGADLVLDGMTLTLAVEPLA